MHIFVLMSNAYVRCLRPFAYLFNKYWSNEQEVDVVGYDIMPDNLPPNFNMISLGQQKDYTWSSGLRKYLDGYAVPEIALFMLEDYFLDRPVDILLVQALHQYMLDHKDVVKIDLTNDRLKVVHENWEKFYGIDLVRCTDNAPFQTSTQAALWRVDFLKEFIKDHENAWSFEKKGTNRIIKARSEGWKGHILGTKSHPLHYVNAIGGEGNHPHKWAVNRFKKEMWNELNERGLI